MKIKRLEITGFKSFKDKTVIHFDAGITAVVGPNGCGKSNIVDALQWVMGEMSAKGLRGSSMEDVIFQGSQGYVPGGLAEVSLILENNGGYFPAKYLNYSELQITRRLHRSGESEYLIQQEPVRLKDIYEIFMDTGVGSKGFSLIEQGAISRMVTAKPEEMRALIEEASGITKFKARKKESQRKLMATDENLTRLNDIINELKRHLSSLERQSKKANQYKKLQEKVEKQDLLISSKDFLDLKEEYTSTQSSSQEMSDKEMQFQNQILEAEKQKETKKLSQLECEKKIEIQQQSIEETRTAIREKENLIQGLEFHIEQSQKQEVLHSDLKSETQSKKEILQKNLQELSSSYENLQKEAHQIESRYQTLNTKYEDNQSQLLEDEKNLKQKQEELMALQQKTIQLEVQIQSLQIKQEEYQTQENEAQSLLESLINKDRAFTKTQHSIERELEEARQLQLNLTSDIEDFKKDKDNLLNTLTKQKKKTDQLKNSKNEMISKLSILEDLYKNFEGFQKGVKEILIWKQQREQSSDTSEHSKESFFVPIADIIDVPTKYELALEAVLGTNLQTILAKSMDDIFKALDFLKQNQCGRASFLYTSIENPSFDMIKENSVIGLLKDFVSTDEKYKSCVDTLLYKVAVVNSISLDLSQKYPDWTFVTLNGDTIFPNNLVRGGTSDDLDSSRLKLRREIKELLEKKATYEKQLTLEEVQLKTEEKRLDDLEKDFEQTQKSHLRQEMKVIELRKDFERIAKQSTEHKDLLEKQSREVDRLLTQKLSQKEQTDSLTKELETSNHQKQNIESEIQKLNEHISMSQKHLDALRQEVHQLRVDSVARTQEAEGKSHQKEMLQKQLDEVSSQITNLIEEEQKSIQASTDNQEKHKKENSVLQELLAEQQEKQENFSKIQNEYEISRSEIEEIDKQLSNFRKESNEIQSKKNDLSLTINTLEIKMNTLVETIQERYLVDLQSIATKYKNNESRNDLADKQGDKKNDEQEQFIKWNDIDWEEAKTKLESLRTQLNKMGTVHLGAIEEYDEVNGRYLFLSQQKDDLILAKEELDKVIDKINKICGQRFKDTFEAVNVRFQKVFPTLFGGGEAYLSLIELKDKEDIGVTITARPPGKRLQNVSLLSGGEKALTAVSLIFAIFLVKPSPYCILDEVDAPLDDANVFRFNDLVKEMSKYAQVILVTHNKQTMEICEKLYGITMEEKGISKMVSVDML